MAVFGTTFAYACVWLTHLEQWQTGNWGRFFTRDVKCVKNMKPTTMVCKRSLLPAKTVTRKRKTICSVHTLAEGQLRINIFAYALVFLMADFRAGTASSWWIHVILYYFIAFILFVCNFLLVSLSRLSERICKALELRKSKKKKQRNAVHKRNYVTQMFCICLVFWSTLYKW